MAPKLYSISGSPAVRSVLMCAKVLELELDLVLVDLFKLDHLKEDFVEKNPQHTIPLLEEEDGFVLADSHAIMGYLVNKYGKDDSLYPKNDSRRRAVIDHMLHFDSGILVVKGFNISKPLLFQKILPTEDKINDLKEVFKMLEAILAKNQTKYVAGDKLTIADFSLITSVEAFGCFTPYAEFPQLKAYIERMHQQPWYEVNKEGQALLEKVFADTISEIKSNQ